MRATTAPSPPRATVFRLAAPGSVPVGLGGEVVLTVPLAPPAEVVAGASVVSAEDVMTTEDGAEVASVDGAEVVASVSEVVAAGADEVSVAEVAALVWLPRGGMLRETPAPSQSAEAAAMVLSISPSEHPA